MISGSKCRGCGKPIVWMKTKVGRSMPCEPELKFYWLDPAGSQRVINHDGEVVRCEVKGPVDEASGLGRIVHWGLCTSPDQIRKRGKT